MMKNMHSITESKNFCGGIHDKPYIAIQTKERDPIMTSKIIPRCSWCGTPNPPHEGGVERRDGTAIQGNFCNREEFDHWLHAHAIIDIVGRKTQ